MNIDIPDHVVFKVDGLSADYCLPCILKIIIKENVKVKAECSSGEFDKCDSCGVYL